MDWEGWRELTEAERKERALYAIAREFSMLRANGRLPRSTFERIITNLGLYSTNLPPYVKIKELMEQEP